MITARGGAEAPPSRPRRAAAAAAVAAGLALYLPTLARHVGFIDRGELAAVAATLGIAHPTGYPTFTLLGRVVAWLAPVRPVIALDVLAAVAMALGLGVLVLVLDSILERVAVGPGAPSARLRAALALLAALATGVTTTWWQQANGFEVYALHGLLLPLVTWTFLRWTDALAPAGASGRPTLAARQGMLFAYTLGLAFTNHMTTLVLAPAFLTYFVARSGFSVLTLRRLLVLVPAFLLALTAYAYLPLRAVLRPRFDWGDPVQPWRFFAHITARQYQVWMFRSLEVAREQLGAFFTRLPAEWAYVGLVVAVLGALRLWRADRVVAAWALLVFAGCLVYVGGYAIRDIDAYTMPAMMALGVWFAVGLLLVHERAGARLALAGGAALAIAGAMLHVAACDESGNRLAENLTRDVLEELPHGALLVSQQWDYTVSPGYYLQAVEGLRPDVTVVNPELMRHPWYLTELARREPAFAAGFARETQAFARAVEPFERGRPYRAEELEAAYEAMLGAMVDRSLGARPVFVSAVVESPVFKRYVQVPAGIDLELRADTGYVAARFPRYRFCPWPGHVDPYVATVSWIYARGLAARMAYELAHGRPERARRYGEYALTFDPGFRAEAIPPLPLDGRAIVAQTIDYFDRLRALETVTAAPAAGAAAGTAAGR